MSAHHRGGWREPQRQPCACAKQLAGVAKTAGADIVKYQTAEPELVVSNFAEKAEYQKAETGAGESQLEMVRRIHFAL